MRLLRDEIAPLTGEIRRAPSLRIVYFDQNRPLNPDLTLRQALSAGSDSVVYQDRSIHVASWAARFLFTSEQLNQPISRLSGGERARVLIANLMLEPADVLLLDEPTNDLDIPTLEILEESLLEFRGALILVTHDRYLLNRVSTVVLGFDGAGGAGRFADYSQWESWQAERKKSKPKSTATSVPIAKAASAAPKKKLSYLDSREFSTIEHRIAESERVLTAARARLEDPQVGRDAQSLADSYREIEEMQSALDTLYARWVELQEKIG